ncbi:ATP-dependent DNA helicase DinG [Pseudoalteromonas ulvae UL12]|uniref:ATP-dependent DNA helicase n=1 Tax=Pseudoalteromonas ulvae TaxID=107327 RepID=UPI00186BA528|nr:ATP-dependent DNA helicase [Pseudoalteromonas ulvae]MBE0366171.1 ATP-dependent DNA helicase DinG [Pseudoalteromonas ulvae UL12]
MANLTDIFSASGPMALQIKGYQPRQAQIDMAMAVEKAILKQHQLVVEAGTGTGKTFAYLAPALLSDKKVIISTGSKALQEQLYHRDLPKLLNVLTKGKKTALLKGRANYLCPHRLNQHVSHVPTDDNDIMHELAMVAKFATETQSGDMADCIGIEEDAKVLPYVTSTAENCLGKECPEYENCYIKKARLKAIDAELVVVNHHLFFADMAVKEGGFGELIPTADAYIFDEAHQLSEIASQYFGQTVSTKSLFDLIKDLRLLYRTELFDMIQLGKALDKLESSVADFRLQFPIDSIRGDWREAIKNPNITRAVERIVNDITFLYQVTKLALERTDSINHLFDRCVSLRNLLETMFDTKEVGFSYWYETTRRNVSFHVTPLNISEKFAQLIENSNAGWIFTSATLSVSGELHHFNQALGLTPVESFIVESPFDYANQALLCLPRYLPEANSPEMAHALVKVSLAMINAAKGRCFVLFTSYRVMNLVAQGLSSLVEYPIFVQGQTSKRILLEKYQRHGNAVLLGTASFWEGVDVRGSSLSCVIIDKLPFVAPDDPLLQAKMRDCKAQGGEPFSHIQLPQAVITLKQGVGRLIRDQQDKGVLVICDNRLVTKQYGGLFLASLPPMSRTRDLDKAAQFLTLIE